MSKPTISEQQAKLFLAISERSAAPVPTADEYGEALYELALWLQYFRSVAEGDAATELLDGILAAALEAVAYAVLGLARAAIAAIRLQLELVIGYTYFRDHPVEWARVGRTGDGFMMFTAVDAYHRDIDRLFKPRLALVEQAAGTTLGSVYRLLSAHVHAQSPLTLPRGSELASLVADQATARSIVEAQRRACEALSNYLIAAFADRWPELPAAIVTRVNRMMTPAQRRSFFRPDTAPG